MSEMLERVARALCQADGCSSDAVLGIVPDIGSVPPADIVAPAWRRYVDKARSAIVAMREPTNDMLEAGAFYFIVDGEAGPTLEAEISLARSTFRAMLEVALKD
jgi:hypothetical protein